MTRSNPSSPSSPPAPSVVILGADALLAALPATPTQLTNACYLIGFHGVFPASWGDELVAEGCIKQLESRSGAAIQCSCPLVEEQLRGVKSLQRHLVPLVSPPAATALYLRAMCDHAPLRITYVGDCPGADDESIDERLSPRELMARFDEQGIVVVAQRTDLGDNPPRDRRRFYSLPGGAPAPEWLGRSWPKRMLVDTNAAEALAELGHRAHGKDHALIDLAPQLGCACAGAVGGTSPDESRRAVAALEPPRARSAVLDARIEVQVARPEVEAPVGAEVTWADFLASLPSTLALDPTTREHPAPPGAHPGAPGRTPVRRGRGGVALPRAYLSSRAAVTRRPRANDTTEMLFTPPGVRRVKPGGRPPARPTPAPPPDDIEPLTPPVAARQAPVPQPALDVDEEQELIEDDADWFVTHGRFGMGRRRWGGVLTAALLAAIAVGTLMTRGFGLPEHSIRADTPDSADTRADSVSRTATRTDSAAVAAPLVPVPLPVGDQRLLDSVAPLSTGVAATNAGAASPTPAPAATKPAAPPPRPTPSATSAPHKAAVVAAPAATRNPTSAQHASQPARPTPPPPKPSSASASTTKGSSQAAPVAAAPAAAAVTSTPPAAAPVPQPPAPPPAAQSAAAQSAPAPTRDTSVDAEIRAIREELAIRKRRIDSLAGSLDSIKKP